MSAATAPGSHPSGAFAHLQLRGVPEFYVVDGTGKVVFACGTGRASFDLERPEIRRAILTGIVDGGSVAVIGDVAISIFRNESPGTELFGISVQKVRNADSHAVAARFGLTPRETEVLRQMIDGAGTAEIAASLSISSATVADHVKHIAAKTGVRTRSQIIVHALRGY